MKNKNWQLNPALLCGLTAMAFTFDKDGITWLWHERIEIPIFLGFISFLFILFWIYNRKTQKI